MQEAERFKVDFGAATHARHTYLADGLGVLPGWFGRATVHVHALELQTAVLEHGTHRDKYVGGRPGEFGERRRYCDYVLNADGCTRWLPWALEIYEDVRKVAAWMTNREVLLSPFGQSAVTAKYYRGPGAEHGWHVDTNSVSGVLYLTDHAAADREGALEFCRPGSREPVISYFPRAGDLAILRGRDVWHRMPPSRSSTFRRGCIVFNLYHPGEVERPAGLDQLHYQ